MISWLLLAAELRLYGDHLRADAIVRCAADPTFLDWYGAERCRGDEA